MGCGSSKEEGSYKEEYGARPHSGQHAGQTAAPTAGGYQYGPNEYGQYGTGTIGGEYQVYYGANEHGQYGVSGQGYKNN